MKKKKSLWILGTFLVIVAGFLYSCGRSEETYLLPGMSSGAGAEIPIEVETKTERDSGSVFIHVCGAVQRPGVYELPAGSRYQDAVQAAGGFAEDADVSFLNLALLLSDGEQLAVPTMEEAKAQREAQVQSASSDGRIDLNQAGKEELMTLPGIGEVRAEAILSYREVHGAFSSVEDLMEVSGIKGSTFEKIKEKVKVGSSDG
ncbi:helix-hairpin-helix domain-containing protein [Hominifimenecus sp. rT4P-3]|uniref:helix-hairpin-helix domain-containing protein n=1 Tax=Hominifimenecus sp. rT4P-3 TaxID=3242979 RepID=UPI003DA4BE12